jgi:ketosteroid isomerase-like protein
MKSLPVALLFLAGVLILPAMPSPSDPTAELLQTEKDFCAMARTAGIEAAFAAYAAPTAVFFDVDPQAHRGPEAVRIRFAGADPKAVLSWVPVEAAVAGSGDLGYTWGTYEYHAPAKDGADRVGTGHYVTVWRRQPDGHWKFVLDTGNPGPSPAKVRS